MLRSASFKRRRLTLLAAVSSTVLMVSSVQAREIVVAKNGVDTNSGDAAHPVLTIQRAANLANPGDTVTVHAGIYREHIDPPRGGTSETQRIVYRAARGEDVKIVGSEHVGAQWTRVGPYWRVVLPKSFFGSFNPFATLTRNPNFVRGDNADGWGWLRYGRWTHLGDVYINGQGLAESENGWTRPLTWSANVDPQGDTTIMANFGHLDPNRESVEVNVRPTVFYPSKSGLSYISLRGFTIMNAASRWSPPQVEQIAAVGPNGGNHWIIEGNTILYAKAVCVSLGVPSGPADEAASGYHIVRNNVIMRCGQAGIVGQRWNAFSTITGNDIEDTNYRLEFGGAETGAIKFHQMHDTVIENNFIRFVGTADPELANGDGIWLDFGNFHNKVRSNVIVGVQGASILMEANFKGPNYIENNVVVGGRVSTYSSRDLQWRYNLFADATGYWVDQTDLKRPPIAGDLWFRNMFVNAWAWDGRDAARQNVYFDGTQPRAAEPGAVTGISNPHFALNLDEAAVIATFDIDPAALRRLRSTLGDGQDFYGRARGRGKVGFGPFADIEPGKNVLTLFRYGPQHLKAVEILKCGMECGQAGK